MNHEPSYYEKVTAIVDRALSVPHTEIRRQESEYRKRSERTHASAVRSARPRSNLPLPRALPLSSHLCSRCRRLADQLIGR
jgi:hypothetical protein